MAESTLARVAPPLDALGRTPGVLPVWARYSLPVRVSFPVANTPLDVPHTLDGAVPTGMLVLWADAEIHAAPGKVWTETTAYLQANAALAHATVVFVLARETPTAFLSGGTVSKGSPVPGGSAPAAHHVTHEPGGSDALVNAAWTNLANVFTQDQTVNSDSASLFLTSPLFPANQRKWQIIAQGDLLIQAVTDADVAVPTFARFYRSGQLTVNGNLLTKDITANGNITAIGLLTVGAGTALWKTGAVGPDTHLYGYNGTQRFLRHSSGYNVLFSGGNALQFVNQAETVLIAQLSDAGLLTVNGTGSHNINGNGPNITALNVNNPANANTSYAQVAAVTDAGGGALYLQAMSGTYTPAGPFESSSATIQYVGSFGLSVYGSGRIRFMPGNIERMIIYADGQTDWPGRMSIWAGGGLTVLTPTGPNHGLMANHGAPGYIACGGYHNANASTAYAAYFYNVNGNGIFFSNTASWTNLSDRSLKTDIRALDVLDRLRQVQPRDFLWKSHATSDRPGQRQYGFVAQEVQDVFPDLVTPALDGKLGVAYTGLIAPLVQGWQDHDARIADLERLVKETHAQ